MKGWYHFEGRIVHEGLISFPKSHFVHEGLILFSKGQSSMKGWFHFRKANRPRRIDFISQGSHRPWRQTMSQQLDFCFKIGILKVFYSPFKSILPISKKWAKPGNLAKKTSDLSWAERDFLSCSERGSQSQRWDRISPLLSTQKTVEK